jgi:hypothetical protein
MLQNFIMMIDEFYLSPNIICVIISRGRYEQVCGTHMKKTSANRINVEIWRKQMIQLIQGDNIKINLKCGPFFNR